MPGAEKEDMEIFEFEKLWVYQKALDFIDRVYEISKKFPAEEKFGMVGQFREASVSIALNTAEGSGDTKMEFRRFLRIARRSVRECVALTEISYRQKYIANETRGSLRADWVDLSKMLSGLLKSLSPHSKTFTPNTERRTPNAPPAAPNAERRTLPLLRRTPNAQRRTFPPPRPTPTA